MHRNLAIRKRDKNTVIKNQIRLLFQKKFIANLNQYLTQINVLLNKSEFAVEEVDNLREKTEQFLGGYKASPDSDVGNLVTKIFDRFSAGYTRLEEHEKAEKYKQKVKHTLTLAGLTLGNQ